MKRYLLVTAALTLGICVLAGLFNYSVDPYGIYHADSANADRLSRIDLFYYLRLTKPWQVTATKPTAVVVGTSRTATVDPQGPGWPREGSYNLSVPGMTPYEMLRFIEHAQANGPLKKLMIGLDFEAFIQPEPEFRQGFEEWRMARTADALSAPRFFWQRLRDDRDALFSLASVGNSLSALSGTAQVGRRYSPDGTWETTGNRFAGKAGFIRIGRGTVFDLRNERLSLDENMSILAEILRFAHRQSIDTRLFITPEHVFMLDLWWRLGDGELWNAFHRRVVAVNEAVARELGVDAFPLFGFNQAAGVVDEPIRNARESKGSTFSDGTHFRSPLGQRIMSSVWDDSGSLGVRLDADAVDGYLQQVDVLRQGFLAANRELAATMRRSISPDLH
ncbi:MAG: hypothetical protein R3E50_09620 [Halioglobus sp.]